MQVYCYRNPKLAGHGAQVVHDCLLYGYLWLCITACTVGPMHTVQAVAVQAAPLPAVVLPALLGQSVQVGPTRHGAGWALSV